MTRFSPSVQRVLDALNEGLDTGPEIREVTGLARKTVNCALQTLLERGVIRLTGRWRKCGPDGNHGRTPCYEPKAWAEAAE